MASPRSESAKEHCAHGVRGHVTPCVDTRIFQDCRDVCKLRRKEEGVEADLLTRTAVGEATVEVIFARQNFRFGLGPVGVLSVYKLAEADGRERREKEAHFAFSAPQ